MTFILFESIPFVALALAARRLGRWLTLLCALAFAGLIFETTREVSASSSSTAALAFVAVPFLLLTLLLVVVAGNEVVRLVVRQRRGGAIGRPSRGELALGLALSLLGFLMLSWLGVLAGLGVTVAVWAPRSERRSLTASACGGSTRAARRSTR